MEFATPLSHDEDRVDAYHDGEPLRYRTMDNILGELPVPGLAQRDFEAELHLACDDGEPRSFAEAEGDAAWRVAMKQEMDAVERNRTWELADLPADTDHLLTYGATVKHQNVTGSRSGSGTCLAVGRGCIR